MGRAKVSLEKKIEIKALVEAGFSQRGVAKQLGVSKNCVLGIAHKLKKNYRYQIYMVKGGKTYQQQLMIEIYYVYANKIEQNLVRNYQLN
jgi:transposase